MSDPAILQRMSDKLTETRRVAAREAQKQLIAANYAAIYDDAGNVILGNPAGDVTLVEMFDYNCGYCRQALPDLAVLMAEDPNLKVILKEFPILSDGSVEAAKVAVLINQDEKLDYWAFHQKLFAARGQVGADAALKVAEEVGGNRVALMLDMNGKAPADAIKNSYNPRHGAQHFGHPDLHSGRRADPRRHRPRRAAPKDRQSARMRQHAVRPGGLNPPNPVQFRRAALASDG